MPSLRALLSCLLLAALPAVATPIYTYIDAEGNRVFTDQPRKNAKRLDVAPTNNMSSTPRTRDVKIGPAQPVKKPMFHYQLLRILVPEPDSTIRSGEGKVIVTVSSDPALQDGHRYLLLLDGQPVGAPGRSPVFALDNLDRGTHQISVEIYDELGRLLEKTPNQPFHLQRISLNQKRLANPCKAEEYGVRPECPLKDKPEEKRSWVPFL
ncbi:DUF4124 domain-containing protein [uncultured Pseudomonas sp.]|uniref:DUF4124 domain-containing protein n=1 Tax=uncultured Pseudomonas sp. TaxID=114707 RepID=UPI0025F0EA1C|nr:DUF4124 domain-containing protein [uncultured Pseudomonas sp.]